MEDFILPYFSLIAAGKAKTVDRLRLLKSYKQEESYIVWNNVAQQLAKISVIIADKEFYADLPWVTVQTRSSLQ